MATGPIIVLSSDEEGSDAHKASEYQTEMGNDKKKSKKNFQDNNGGLRKKLKGETGEERVTKNTDVAEVKESEVFQDFVSECLKVDTSVSMKKIVTSKIQRYYRLLRPEYRSSDQLSTLLMRKTAEMQRSPSNRFMHIKEVVDELQVHRADKASVKPSAPDRYIRRLCRVLEILQIKIKKLEEKEVNWDDENDSTYIQMQKYRERLVKVHNKIQELEGLSTQSSRYTISFTGTPFAAVNKTVEKFINSKRTFPDFLDVAELLKKTYSSENITVSEEELHVQAKKAFQNIGEQLQKQRQYENWEAHSVFLKQEDRDPAEDNAEMRTQLDKNQEQFKHSIDEIMTLYVVKSEERRKKAVKLENEDEKIDEGREAQNESDDDDEGDVDGGDDDEGDDDDGDDDDDDGEEDHDGCNDDQQEENDNIEDVGKRQETVDDILEDVDLEDSSCDATPTPGSSEPLFQYCGPVSPPARSEDPTHVTLDHSSDSEPDSEENLCNTVVSSPVNAQDSKKTTEEKNSDSSTSFKPKQTPASEDDIVLID